MIQLEDISTYRLMGYVSREKDKDITKKYVYELFVKYEITNYQKLKDLLNSNDPKVKCVSEFLNNELYYVEREVKQADLLGLEPEVFTFETYQSANIDDETLKLTDEENQGNILLYSNPMIRGGARVNVLKYMTIADIKHLASHLSSYSLNNALTYKRNFGIDTVKRVVEMVKFYEQQVLRQAQETEEREINLFMLNKKAKTDIVESEIKDIVEYLVDNAEQCIWGNMSPSTKLRVLRAVFAVRGEQTLDDRRRLVNAISNYTTLSELEQGVVKKRTLDRFIIK